VDLAYATRSTQHKLDLHLPTVGKAPFPVVVWIHGGAWLNGDKRLAPSASQLHLLKYGVAVASVNYRFSSQALFPAQIQDVKAAVRWIRGNAKKYGLDTARVAAWGSSAGGYLAALLGTSGGVASLSDLTLGNPTMSDRVTAVVDFYGPAEFLTLDAEMKAIRCPLAGGIGFNSPKSPPSLLLGAAIQTVPARAASANPATYIDAKDPPFLIQHGSADCQIPRQQSANLQARLVKALGTGKVIFQLLPGAGHGGAAFYKLSNTTFVATWLKAKM
jgi:acetyl esterase/lipase